MAEKLTKKEAAKVDQEIEKEQPPEEPLPSGDTSAEEAEVESEAPQADDGAGGVRSPIPPSEQQVPKEPEIITHSNLENSPQPKAPEGPLGSND